MPAAGTYISGVGGAFALKSLESGGTIRYLPMSSFNPYNDDGTDVVPLVNNDAFPVNEVDGCALGQFSLNLPLLPLAMPADFFTRAFCCGLGDHDGKNYHTLTRWPDAAGSSPDVYGLCKFASLQGRVRWNRRGGLSAFSLVTSGLIIDPLSGSVAALTAPSSGALSTANLIAFAQVACTGVSEQAEIEFQVSTGLEVSPGNKAGSGNPRFPVLCKGLQMNGQGGYVNITQPRNPTTALGKTGTLTLNCGAAANGVAMQFELLRRGDSQPSNLGPNLLRTSYVLKSLDGTTYPFSVTDM